VTESLRIDAADVAKSFGATQALSSGSLRLRPGEVHTLIGENGSGKSTLVKILAGVDTMDRGTLRVEGRSISRIVSPRHAKALGIATVFQEVRTVGPQSVLDNIWLGADGAVRPAADRGSRRSRAGDVLSRLVAGAVDLDAPAETLSLSWRQLCCIARALVTQPRILILDESTSALDVEARDRLFAVIRELRDAGTSVLFISHRMDEVFQITDVITVLRSGSTVASRVPAAQSSASALVGLMTGGDVRDVTSDQTMRRQSGPVVLAATGIRLSPGAAPVDLRVRAGELVGLAGLEGQGQDRFLHALRGVPALAGTVSRVDGDREHLINRPADAHRHAIAYVPRDRRDEALLEHLSVRENFGLPTLRADTIAGLVRPARTVSRLASHVSRLGIALRSPADPISTLSGGNQQKTIIARWLAANPSVLLLNDPTRGIDLNAKRDLYALMRQLCDAGVAVVMLSSEVDELLEVMDRVLVFRESAVAAELDRSSLTRPALIGAYFGHKDGVGA
jgi:ABC-type sugar transport system ATPase subunit